MKLVMTLVVRDEADIIAANLDYHLAQGVDAIIVTDHGSTDGTTEILESYARDQAVHVIRDAEVGHHQSRRVTAMAELASERFAADWIIHTDADEFWWPVAGSLRDVFAAIPDEYGALQVWRRYNFLPAPDADRPFQDRLVVRDAVSLNGVGNPLEPKVAHRPDPDVVIAPGNHWLVGGTLKQLPHADMLEIFHFPARSWTQFERKVIKLGHGYEQAGPLSSEVGRDQLAMLEIHRRGELAQRYAYMIPAPEQLAHGLEEKRYVVDRRLQQFLAEIAGLAPGERPAAHAAGPAIRALAAAAFDAERAAERSEVAMAQAEQAAEGERATQESMHAVTAERDSAIAALASLQNSRSIRMTAPARRIWHRISRVLEKR